MDKKLIVNAVGFNAVWFAWAFLVPKHQYIVPAFLSAVYMAWHLKTSPTARVDAWLIVVSCTAGFMFDSLLVMAGWLQFALPNPAPFNHVQPLWMSVMWAAFACTLNHSMAWLRKLHVLAAGLLCGVLGYLSYVGAMKLGALTLQAGIGPMAALFVFWGVFIQLVQRKVGVIKP